MNFKEALIAHLQGEKVEARYKCGDWTDFGYEFQNVTLKRFSEYYDDSRFEFRLAPRTIRVNGVEVPAPEKYALTIGVHYYVPDPSNAVFCFKVTWQNLSQDDSWFARGLVYLTKEDAIARAKAMLLTQE